MKKYKKMQLKKLEQMIKEKKQSKICKECNNIGYVQDAKGKPVHICYKCLFAGRLDQCGKL